MAIVEGQVPSASLAGFVSQLRAHGLAIGTGELVAAERALAAIEVAERRQAKLALRATLCSDRGDLATFDRLFDEWSLSEPDRSDRQAAELVDPAARIALPRVAVPSATALAQVPEEADQIRPAAWSDVELLRDKDFAEYTDAERAAAQRIVRRLAAGGARRPARRMRPSTRRGPKPDLRRTLGASVRRGGEPFDRRWLTPGSRDRRVVLICDISGSMEVYSRMLLTYAHALVAFRGRTEAFVFGTQLTRITGELRAREPDRAIEAATAAVSDWSGGTRIGHSIAQLNRTHGRRIGRGSVIVILSDGWDRGEPTELGEEMARLGRCAHRLVWLNPLSARDDYEPLARGMAAALPHIDALLAGNTLRSLAQLSASLERELIPKAPRRPPPRGAGIEAGADS